MLKELVVSRSDGGECTSVPLRSVRVLEQLARAFDDECSRALAILTAIR